jgi:hypothetical protein
MYHLSHLTFVHGIVHGDLMPINLLASMLSWTFAGAGITLLASSIPTSLGEHVDAVMIFSGFLLVLLGFWLRDWKTKMEIAGDKLAARVSTTENDIVAVKGDVKRVEAAVMSAAQEFRHLANDVRRFHYWAYQVIGGLTATSSTPPGATSPFAPGERRVINHDPELPVTSPILPPDEVDEADEDEEKKS